MMLYNVEETDIYACAGLVVRLRCALQAARSASPSCFSESQVPRHRHAPGSPPLHDNACQRGAEFVADRADGGSADGAGGGGGGGGGRGSSDTNGSDSAMRAERNDVTENRWASGGGRELHARGRGWGRDQGRSARVVKRVWKRMRLRVSELERVVGGFVELVADAERELSIGAGWSWLVAKVVG